VCGCNRLTPSKPLNELTPQEASGRQVFVSRCSSCHSADTEKGLNGPGLEGLFRKPYLHSGMAANDARVTEVIVHGRNMMPALAIHCQISSWQIDGLPAYVMTKSKLPLPGMAAISLWMLALALIGVLGC